MKLNKKLLVAAAISTTAISAAYAADVDIDANALFRAAVSFGTPTAMDFGTIDVTGSPTNQTIVLDVADASLTAGAGYDAAATGTLGSVDVSATSGQTIDIFCETTGSLGNAAGDSSIALINTEIEFGGASESSCAGLGSAAISGATSTGTDTITMGGTLNLISAPNAEAYSTTTNGTAVQITAVY